MSVSGTILTEDLFFSLIDHIIEMVVGVEKIIGIYTHPELGELRGITLKYRNNKLQEHDLDLSKTEGHLISLRRETNMYKWIDKNHMPLETIETGKTQLNIFDEYKHLVLLISLPGEQLDKNILLIYFKDEINSFGVQHQKAALSTDNKSIIGHLLSRSIHSFCKQYWKEKLKFNSFSKKTQRILELQRSHNKDTIRKEELEHVVLSYAYEYLAKFSDSEDVNYVYSNCAIKKIRNYAGDFCILQKALKEAFEYTKVIFTSVTKTVHGEFIDFDTYVNKNNDTIFKENTSQLSSRLQKVYDFLDRLEVATIKVNNTGLNITGVNIGNMMENPISAAAISDYIGKNRDRINKLFDIYPNRWSFSKNNFKSLINIIIQNGTLQRKWS